LFELHPAQSVTFQRDIICKYQYQQHATKCPLIYFKITKNRLGIGGLDITHAYCWGDLKWVDFQQCWWESNSASLQRHRQIHSPVFGAISLTGVSCRPSCAAVTFVLLLEMKTTLVYWGTHT